MKKNTITLALGMGAALMSAASFAAPKADPKLCVYDMLGSAGDIFNMTKDYTVAMKAHGVNLQAKVYTDERVASQELMAGQCDALFATGLRTRPFNAVAGAMDALGSTSVSRNGTIDLPAGYQVVRRAVQTYASPATAKLMVNGNYEVGGIIPFGTAYFLVRDRNLNTVPKLAGHKMAIFDYDKAQVLLSNKVGIQAISADITSFAGKFNNGSVDMIAAPAAAYRPLELHRGLGSNGTIHRFPFVVLTYQMIINKNSFPEGFGLKSRQYWVTQFDRALALITKAEKDIPAAAWSEVSPTLLVEYTGILRETRLEAAEQGIYDKQGLKIMKRIRCSVNPADGECASSSESWN